MGIKRYIIASFVLLGIIAGYIYFGITTNSYKLQILEDLFGYSTALPIVFWIMLPTVILLIVTLVHLFYYGLKNYMINRAFIKDNENLLVLIQKRLLDENISLNFQNNETKDIADILSQLDLKISNIDFNTKNKKINQIVKNIIDIQGNKYISSKELKLSKNSVLNQQNLKNRIDIDDNFALEVLKQPSSYKQDVIKSAFLKIVENKPTDTIKKYLETIKLDIEMLKAFVKKDSQNTDTCIGNELLFKLFTNLKITNEDLIQIARDYKNSMTPEQLIKLFEDLASQDEQFTKSYLYVLSEYQMIDQMREILINSQKDEFIVFKAYLDLRDAGKHYHIDSLL
jgi:hypothetical protein